MRIDNDPKLDFDDVLIRPKRSEAPSRSDVDLEREYGFLNSTRTWRGIPLVASNMDTVGTMDMARALGPQLLTCLHKYYPESELAPFLQQAAHREHTFVTIGIGDQDFDKLALLVQQMGQRRELHLWVLDRLLRNPLKFSAYSW